MPKVIISSADPVGKTMLKLAPSFEYITVAKDTIELFDLDKKYKTDLFIVVSRHESKSKIPIFSAHFTGELNKGLVGPTYPSYHREFLQIINSMNPNIEVTTEPMHHSPVLSVPTLFVELGSSLEEWNDKSKVSKLMNAVEELISKKPKKTTAAAAIGFNHYPRKITQLILKEDYAFGPIISKYYVDYLTEDIFKELIEKSTEKIEVVFIDKKIKIKNDVKKWCEELNVEPVRI